MSKHHLTTGGLVVVLLSVLGGAALAQDAAKPFVHPLFTSNMVLQRDVECPVWGWTEPGAKVTVTIAGRRASDWAGPDGKWMVRLPSMPAGGPYDMYVDGPKHVSMGNVLLGDVWICSGQSNMQMAVASCYDAEAEIADANYKGIRLFTVPTVTAFSPQETVNAQWVPCSSETVPGFSAVGYFFGRDLHKELDVPIGLINSSWGGTIAEAWTSGDALKADMPDFVEAVQQIETLAADPRPIEQAIREDMAKWWAANDPGSAAGAGWEAPALNTADWSKMALPQHWESGGFGEFDGVAWFRTTVDLPAGADPGAGVLHLGAIDDRDTTWVNGVEVGAMNVHNQPRVYEVPAGVLKPGKNVVAVRVLDTGGSGGFSGPVEEMRLECGGRTLSLAGEWACKMSTPMGQTTPPPADPRSNPNVVTVLYNAMIAPLVPYAIKGAIWYQGESNCGRSEQYARLLPTMIRDWRARFGVGDFPFLIVHLANFMQVDAEPKDEPWARLREAQWLTTQAEPNVGLAVAIDIGDANDIHPKNKQDVGRRLALAALAIGEGQEIVHSGPVYESMRVEGNAIRLWFGHRGNGLVAKGDKLTGFAIAGEDGRFVWAEARIDGQNVVVSSPQVAAPVAVRYAWGNNPVCNLYNSADLPAVPFRTDNWEGAP